MCNNFELAEENYQKGMDYLNGTNDTNIDYRKAFEMFKKSADEGHPEAQFRLGYMYIYLEPYVLRNYKKAFELFKNSVDQGLIISQFYLAECYMYGWGTEKNEGKAVELYEKCSEQYIIQADDRLCDIYRYCIGVEKDLKKVYNYNERTRGYGNFNSEARHISLINQIQEEDKK